MFRLVLLGVQRLSSEERAEVERAVAGARILRTDSDLALYTVLEDDGRTSEQQDVIAPLNDELFPGSEVVFEGQVSTLFRTGPTGDPSANIELRFAERVVATDWEAFWSQ